MGLTPRRLGRGLVMGLGALVLLAILGVFILTNTPWGREQVRGFAEAQLNEIVEGQVEIGRIDGNLLRGGTVRDLTIVDLEGRPFLSAAEVEWRHSLSDLVRQRIVLTRLGLRRAHLVLDQRPGEEWNFARIFPVDPDSDPDPEPDAEPGFGDWVELRDVQGEDLDVTVRMPWEPEPELTEEERDERVRRARAGETLELVVEGPEGFQSVMEFSLAEAHLPRIVIADPETDELSVEIARMSGTAEPFRSPNPGVIEDLSALVQIGPERLTVQDLALSLPASELTAHAVFVPETAALQATVDADRVTLDDFRFLYPPLPAGITGEAVLALQLDEAATRANLRELDLQIGDGRLEGRGTVEFGDRIVLADAELGFEGIQTRFVEELLADLELPPLELPQHGELSGRIVAASEDRGEAQPPALVDGHVRFLSEAGQSSVVRVDGGVTPGEVVHLNRLRVRLEPLRTELVRATAPELPLRGEIRGQATFDGPVTGPLTIEGAFAHRDPGAGTSRVSVAGEVAFMDELRVSHGVVRLEPLQVALLQEIDPEFPLGGTVEGIARLDGTLEEGLRFDSEFLHRQDEDESSRIAARGEMATTGDGRVSAQVELHDVSLFTAGRFAPDAGLRGSLEGDAEIEGTFQELAASIYLVLPGDGILESQGAVDLTGEVPFYQVGLRLQNLDLSAVSGRIEEETSIGGTVEAQGVGTDPAQMRAELSADLLEDGPWASYSRAPGSGEEETQEAEAEVGPRSLQARLGIEEGLIRVDTLSLAMPSAEVRVQGSFGLTDDHSGALAYRVSVDSLHVLEPFLSTDPGVVAPRPAVREAAVEVREEELADIVRDAQVEFLATGNRPALPEQEEIPGLEGIPRDVLTGNLEVSGMIEGNLSRFDVEGGLNAEELVFLGNRVEEARGSYTLVGVSPGQGVDVGEQEPDPARSRDSDEERSGLRARVELEAEELFLAGFRYDRIAVDGDFQSGETQTGGVALEVHQDPETTIRVEGGVEVAGDAGQMRLDEVTLEFEDAIYRLLRPGVVRWSDRSIEVVDLTLESDLNARLAASGSLPLRESDLERLDPETGRPGTMEFSMTAFELAHLSHLAQMEEGLEGWLSLQVEMLGSLERPKIGGTAGLTGVTFSDQALPELHAEVDYSERVLNVDAWALQEDRRVFVAEARLPMNLGLLDVTEARLLDGPIAGTARIEDLRLEGLDALSDEIQGIAGGVDAQFSVAGTYESPEVAGGAEVAVPTVFLEPLGLQVNDLTGAVSLRDQVLVVDSVVAYSRGPIRASGQVDLADLAAPRFDLQLRATNAQVMNTEEVRARVDAQIAMAGPLEEVMVTGEVRTREGVIRIPSTNELAEPPPLDLGDPALRARLDPRLIQEIDRLVDTSPLLENLQVDLDLQIGRGMWVRSSDINVELSTPPAIGPLQVRMNGIRPEDISLDGTVQTERGEYEFMGRRFSLSRGTVTFVGGATLEPLIRLTAEHEVQLPGREPFDIRIVLDGTPLELDTELESTAEPPLSQTDLLSFVVFGRDAGSLLTQHGSALSGQGSTGGPLVGAVASRAAQQFATVGFDAVLGEMEAETARALRLDVLNIRPAELPAELSTGEFADLLRGTEFEAGRYVTSRLFISGQARPTFVHPGARMDYETEHGWVWRVTWRPRFLPAVPTLLFEEPDRASVFGSLLFREWRF
jgi:hypothetical protein